LSLVFTKKKKYKLDVELKEILLNLQGYELTLGYRKLTKYLRNKYCKIWNKKKVYLHMKTLKILQPKNIKRHYMRNRRLAFCSPIHSNVRWEADLVCVPTLMGMLYLFVVEDVYDKEILGGHMDIRCRADEAINALKKALVYFYPSIKEIDLSDFKVRIINQEGTASKVRVLAETYDKDSSWGTIGAHENIIVASWDALVDGYIFKLLKDKSNW